MNIEVEIVRLISNYPNPYGRWGVIECELLDVSGKHLYLMFSKQVPEW